MKERWASEKDQASDQVTDSYWESDQETKSYWESEQVTNYQANYQSGDPVTSYLEEKLSSYQDSDQAVRVYNIVARSWNAFARSWNEMARTWNPIAISWNIVAMPYNILALASRVFI